MRTHEEKRPPQHRTVFCKVRDAFSFFARATSRLLGTAWAFAVAILIILVWAATGSVFHYSDTWQLIINTGTTIVTFLMCFLIQNTQNRDSRAVHLKLDELISALKGARNTLVNLEGRPDEDLEKLQRDFEKLASGQNEAAAARQAD